MNRLVVFAIVALVASSSLLVAASKEETQIPEELKHTLAMFEIYSGANDEGLDELREFWDPEVVDDILALLAGKQHAAEIEKLPRVHSLANAIKRAPNGDLDSIFAAYKDERHKLLGDVENFDTIKYTPTGQLIHSLICPEHQGNQTFNEQDLINAMSEAMVHVNAPVSTLDQLEEAVTFIGSIEVSVFVAKTMMQYMYSLPIDSNVGKQMREEMERLGVYTKCVLR